VMFIDGVLPVVGGDGGVVNAMQWRTVGSCTWSTAALAPWFDSNRRTEITRRPDLRAALLAHDTTADFQTRTTSGDAQKIGEGGGGQERTRGSSIVRKSAWNSGGIRDLRWGIPGTWRPNQAREMGEIGAERLGNKEAWFGSRFPSGLMRGSGGVTGVTSGRGGNGQRLMEELTGGAHLSVWKEKEKKEEQREGENRGGLVRWLLGWTSSRVGPVAAFLLFFLSRFFFFYLLFCSITFSFEL
jgi:hypothetical protein